MDLQSTRLRNLQQTLWLRGRVSPAPQRAADVLADETLDVGVSLHDDRGEAEGPGGVRAAVHRQPLRPNDSDTTAQDTVCPRPFIEEAENMRKSY